jgi:tetratricopeptide (TPR) repeat protein
MTLLNDSVLLSNNYVWPHFQGNIDIYFMDKMGNEFSRSYIIGSFIITPNGLLVDLNFNENKGLSKGATKKFIDILKNTSGYWDLPKLSKPFYYKINFTTRFINNGYKRSIGFRFNSDVPPCFENCAVSLSQLQKASNYFNKGTNLLIKGKLEKSIVQFTDCINIDSICIDAYYNRAAALYKLNNLDAACKDWRKLYELGQKEGERLFIQNCKK